MAASERIKLKKLVIFECVIIISNLYWSYKIFDRENQRFLLVLQCTQLTLIYIYIYGIFHKLKLLFNNEHERIYARIVLLT